MPGEGSTVLSGLGVWPLLAILAQLADEPARSELAAAAGAQYEGLLTSTPELRMALGLWTRPEVPLEPGLDKVLPPEVRGVLTSHQVLDDWVVERTGGLIQRMPVMLTPDVLLVLASALALRTTWRLAFRETAFTAGATRWLHRSDYDLESVRRYESPGGPLTVVTVLGEGQVDVRLVIGEPGRGRNAVLAAALELDGEGVGGVALLAGQEAPGVEVIQSMSPTPIAILSMPYFEVDVEHDLLEHAEVFGLVTATDNSRGHFPGLSPMPLAVGQARQAVMARFSATGFEAAAVTAVAMAPGSAPTPGAKALYVQLNRPFGFVAVHRPTGIPVIAGWVTETAHRQV